MTENILHKNPYPLGAHIEGQRARFSFVSRAGSCGILLYDGATGALKERIPFSEEDRTGNIYCRTVDDIDPGRTTYLFYEGDRLVPDERARFFPGKALYGRERTAEDLRAGFVVREFDWGEDCCPRLAYSRVVGYCMHVRGFTRHPSSRVKQRGTFAGIVEKIPYLREIGITTLELQPAYEFEEIISGEAGNRDMPYAMPPAGAGAAGGRALNYWGYRKGYYYAPKAAYAASGDAPAEMRELVRALHENGMELVMQFYFPEEVRRGEILDILRFWVLEYHVDGFRLLGDNLPVDMAAADDMLADTKIWYGWFDAERMEQPSRPHAAEYNDAWCYDMRRFLKGDANMLGDVLCHMRRIPKKTGLIHYMSNYCGFTLADLVAYDYKHNEANGEDNRDGNDVNCSWNCGEEGPARKTAVRRLRLKQMKNAMCLLLLSQSTPLIFMGDEFGNSQKGNNNPYCQDNATAWIDWRDAEKHAELLAFWKMLVAFRREHPILRPEQELTMMDTMSCGYPDLSYHGQNAWRFHTEGNFRHIGVMLCGKYAEGGNDTFLYIAMNMHWEPQVLALPKLPKGMRWEECFSTEPEDGAKKDAAWAEGNELRKGIPPRCIAVYAASPARHN